jgi:phosphoribosyl-AMP cyclohydrolase / phosphoribosyl-ATP pyrophosphohydrolase
MSENLENLNWAKGQGLIPVVVQDSKTLQVLMTAYMNREALAQTMSSRKVTFFSRTKDRLWTKGETSGNFLEVESIAPDCDSDALLIYATPSGPACHRSTPSCFGETDAPGIGFLTRLETIIADRHRLMPEGSYTASLFEKGLDRIAQKVGEEAVEVVIAAKNGDPKALKSEAADLLFHLLVLLEETHTPLDEVLGVLRERNER